MRTRRQELAMPLCSASSEANRKIAALDNAVESGVAVEDLTAALRRSTAERDELKARLEQAERTRAMSAAQISELVEELGGLSAVLGAATGAERAEMYASLGLRLDYDPHLRRVTATADLSRVAGCVIAASPLNTLHRLGNKRERSFRSPQSRVRGGVWVHDIGDT
jgi:hypothetical protein